MLSPSPKLKMYFRAFAHFRNSSSYDIGNAKHAVLLDIEPNVVVPLMDRNYCTHLICSMWFDCRSIGSSVAHLLMRSNLCSVGSRFAFDGRVCRHASEGATPFQDPSVDRRGNRYHASPRGSRSSRNRGPRARPRRGPRDCRGGRGEAYG